MVFLQVGGVGAFRFNGCCWFIEVTTSHGLQGTCIQNNVVIEKMVEGRTGVVWRLFDDPGKADLPVHFFALLVCGVSG